MANQFLSLAMFLMLLSFFIVMNAVSDFEDTKEHIALKSLSLAFSNKLHSFDKGPRAINDDTSLDVRSGNTLEDIEGLFKSHLSNFQATRNRLGTTMHVRILVSAFEYSINIPPGRYESMPNMPQGSFVQTMISLLRSGNNNIPYRMDMVLNVSEDPALSSKEDASDVLESLQRVSKLASKLEEIGMPKKMLSSGLKKGDSSFIDLYFYRYQPLDLRDYDVEDSNDD